MKLECSVEKIKKAMALSERVTGKNLTLPILSSVLCIASRSSLILRSTNLSLGIEMEIPAKVEQEGVVAVKGDVVLNVLNSISGSETVTITSVNDNITLTTKSHSIVVKSFPYEDFPTVPQVQGVSFDIPSKKLIDGIKSVFYSASISEIKPEIASIYVYTLDEQLVFVATDTFRLAEKKIKLKSVPDMPQILIPYKNIGELIKVFSECDEMVKVTLSKNQCSFSCKGIYITSRLVDGVFPDYRQIFPSQFETEILIVKQDLLNALRISTVFSDKFNQVTITTNNEEKKCTVSAKSDVGEQTTMIAASIKGPGISVNFNYKYLLDCFQSIPEESIIIHCNQPNKPVIVGGKGDDSFSYLLMPMNR
jgi:DNA polymerase III subunit beta